MSISGFSFVRNADKLYFPAAEAIRSILPICDEFIVALGQGDPDDKTRDSIAGIGSDKVRIIDTVWDESQFVKGAVHAYQTNIALKECSGDWCFYLQADEVVHEKYLDVISQRCADLKDDQEVEGFLFRYKHFWGDYWHYHDSRAWYRNEIRIVRNGIGIESKKSAQSFRRGDKKLKVADSGAEIYHYGWTRPPHYMQAKNKVFLTIHRGKEAVEGRFDHIGGSFDYRPLDALPRFTESHPEVMQKWIERFDRADEPTGEPDPRRKLHKHERFKYQFLTFLDKHVAPLRGIGEYKNWTLLKNR